MKQETLFYITCPKWIIDTILSKNGFNLKSRVRKRDGVHYVFTNRDIEIELIKEN